jgi:hypothetical protein
MVRAMGTPLVSTFCLPAIIGALLVAAQPSRASSQAAMSSWSEPTANEPQGGASTSADGGHQEALAAIQALLGAMWGDEMGSMAGDLGYETGDETCLPSMDDPYLDWVMGSGADEYELFETPDGLVADDAIYPFDESVEYGLGQLPNEVVEFEPTVAPEAEAGTSSDSEITIHEAVSTHLGNYIEYK